MAASKTKIVITRCYLIQITDKDGNELVSEYYFGNRKDTDRAAKDLRANVETELELFESEEY